MHRTTPVIELFSKSYRPTNLPGCSRHTPGGHLAAIRGLEAYWLSQDATRAPPLTIGDWTRPLMASYLNSLLETRGLRKGTYNKHLRHLTALWNFGILEAERIALETGDHPGIFRMQLRLKCLKVEEDDPECWSQDEFAKLLVSACETPGYVGDCPAKYWWPSLILMDYSTGVRIDAVMHIQSAHLDLDARWVKVLGITQKDKEGTTMSLQQEICDVLRLMQHKTSAGICRLHFLFGDWPYKVRSLTEHYKKILQRAGLPFTEKDLWHKLRRTFGTEVARSAGPIVAQTLLGHSHPSVTKRYIDPRQLDKPNAADLIRPPALPVQLRLFKPDEPPRDQTPPAKAG